MTQKPGEFSKPPGGGNVSLSHSTEAVLDTPAKLTSMSEIPDSVKEAAMAPIPDSGPESIVKEMGAENPDFSKFCPMCGWNQDNQTIVEVTEEDKRDFLLSSLKNDRFRKTYERLGGRLKITMRSRTAAETDMLTEQLARDQKLEGIEAAYILQLRSIHYQMLLGLESLGYDTGTEGSNERFEPISTDLPPEPKEGEEAQLTPLQIADRDVSKKWSETTYSIIQNVARHFEQVIQHLVMRAHDPDFWQETATQD